MNEIIDWLNLNAPNSIDSIKKNEVWFTAPSSAALNIRKTKDSYFFCVHRMTFNQVIQHLHEVFDVSLQMRLF